MIGDRRLLRLVYTPHQVPPAVAPRRPVVRRPVTPLRHPHQRRQERLEREYKDVDNITISPPIISKQTFYTSCKDKSSCSCVNKTKKREKKSKVLQLRTYTFGIYGNG